MDKLNILIFSVFIVALFENVKYVFNQYLEVFIKIALKFSFDYIRTVT